LGLKIQKIGQLIIFLLTVEEMGNRISSLGEFQKEESQNEYSIHTEASTGKITEE